MADVTDIFARYRLPPGMRNLCWAFARARYPDARIDEASAQGYCSYTLYLNQDSIIQFRPPAHRIEATTIALARRVYGGVAPLTRFLGTVSAEDDDDNDGDGDDGIDSIVDSADTSSQPRLLVYFMARIPGISLAELRRNNQDNLAAQGAQLETLVRDLASFVARGWASPLAASSSTLARLKGRVGSSLRWRVSAMQTELPLRFRPIVSRVLSSLPEIEALPWVLTHGDLVPANIMVLLSSSSPQPDRENHDFPSPCLRLSGLIDWAEAEYLPFGVGLYGLEELLGYSVGGDSRNNSSGDAEKRQNSYPPSGSCFSYFDSAERLCDLLWAELESAIPELSSDAAFRQAVDLARLLGILLWHGIAFDDGRLDRVVREGKDDEEMQRLDVMLLGRGNCGGLAMRNSYGIQACRSSKLAR